MNKADADQFEHAFSMHICGPVAECECGKVYWDSHNTGYDWSEGERESLAANPKAINVPHGVERIELEGRIYCMDCTCWHERAERITSWLREHQRAVGDWFRLEKLRLEKAAAEVPTV